MEARLNSRCRSSHLSSFAHHVPSSRSVLAHLHPAPPASLSLGCPLAEVALVCCLAELGASLGLRCDRLVRCRPSLLSQALPGRTTAATVCWPCSLILRSDGTKLAHDVAFCSSRGPTTILRGRCRLTMSTHNVDSQCGLIVSTHSVDPECGLTVWTKRACSLLCHATRRPITLRRRLSA